MEFFSQLNQLPAKELLALTVLGAIVTTGGSLLAMVIKDYFFARSIERWKDQRELESVYRKYRDPIVLATLELIRILRQIEAEYVPAYFDSKYVEMDPQYGVVNTTANDYFRKYKLTSAVFRLCAFLGWLELYRQDIVFLDSGHNAVNQKLEKTLKLLRNDFADGYLNEADDWEDWLDPLLFREELRAIGESMISPERTIIGYAKFYELFTNPDDPTRRRWIVIAVNFFLAKGGTKDFRVVRIRRIICRLVDLAEVLDPSRVTEKHRELRLKLNDGLATNEPDLRGV